jgi:iron complex outermembrane receptor protein
LKTNSAALCAALAALLADSAAAETPLEEVMVTASRVEKPLSTIPNTVTVVNTAELDEQLAIHNDISTVLGNLIPSFSPSRQ